MLPTRIPGARDELSEAGPARSEAVHDHDAIEEALTILALAASVGVRPRQAIQIAARSGRGSLADDLAAVAARLARGSDLTRALRSTTSVDDRVRRLHRILDMADVDGTDYSAAIETVRSDLRRERMAELETAAQRLSVAIQFPLVICILPAFIVLALVPLVLAVIADIGI